MTKSFVKGKERKGKEKKREGAIALFIFGLILLFEVDVFSITPLVGNEEWWNYKILCFFFGAENEHVSTLTPDTDRGQLFR